MNDCPNGEVRDLLPDLLHGRLDGAGRAAVEEHVASCADCQAELALLTDMRSTLRRASAIDTRRIAAAIGAAPAAPTPLHRTPVRQGWGGWRAAAAIAAIAVGGSAVAIARHEPATLAPTVAVAPRVAADTPFVPPVQETTTVATATRAPSGARATRQLAVSGEVSDLSDRELAALLGDLESLEVLPSADVDAGPLVPVSGSGDAGAVL
jgi:anti-sigma factor RsiW